MTNSWRYRASACRYPQQISRYSIVLSRCYCAMPWWTRMMCLYQVFWISGAMCLILFPQLQCLVCHSFFMPAYCARTIWSHQQAPNSWIQHSIPLASGLVGCRTSGMDCQPNSNDSSSGFLAWTMGKLQLKYQVYDILAVEMTEQQGGWCRGIYHWGVLRKSGDRACGVGRESQHSES